MGRVKGLWEQWSDCGRRVQGLGESEGTMGEIKGMWEESERTGGGCCVKGLERMVTMWIISEMI